MAISAGLIHGRHEMPVDLYIFDDIKDVHDYTGMRKRINDFLTQHIHVVRTYGIGINQADATDVELFIGKEQLILYITGLTPVVAEVIAACARNGIRLTLMNYDLSSGNYIPQPLF